MSTIIRHLNFLPPAELDRYLQYGWRTTGQAVYNCNFLWLENGEMISVLPMRLSLKEHHFSKSMRKILRRNLARFRVSYAPGRYPDDPAIAVNMKYLGQYPDKSLYNLDYHITGNHHRRVLNTWETRVYDGKQLVSVSYFDLGETTAYSKACIYDPEYGRFSLGLFTMALEIQFCQRRGLQYYFPGYVSDDNPLFDYKHRIGAMDFYDLQSQEWLPYGKHAQLQRPLGIIRQRLEAVLPALRGNPQLEPEILVYPHIDARYSSMGHNEYLDVPMFLMLRQTGHDRYHILNYLADRSCFQVIKVRESQFALNRGNYDRSGLKNCSFALIVEKVLLDNVESPAEIASAYLSSYCI